MSNGKGTKALFAGRHFDREVILLCVRWYLRYKLRLRDLVEMMAERGLGLAHTTIMRWVQRYVPEFEKSWARYARKVGRSWRVDETYLKDAADGSISTVPCREQGGQYSRLPSEPKERRCSGQGILPQSAPHPRACTPPPHPGSIC